MRRQSFTRLMVRLFAMGVPGLASPRSQAANGNVEGVARVASGALLPAVTLTVANAGTRAERTVLTNTQGVHRGQIDRNINRQMQLGFTFAV